MFSGVCGKMAQKNSNEIVATYVELINERLDHNPYQTPE